MIDYVLEEEVYNGNYTTWLTKNQLLWGGNGHWKTCPDKYLQKGIYLHAGITKPKQDDLNYQKRRFGYCLEWPQPQCWDLVSSIIKKSYVNKKATGKDFASIEFLYGKGYIDAKGKLDPHNTKGIVGYFIMSANVNIRQTQIKWIQNQSIQIRGQWGQSTDTFISTVRQQVESGHRKAVINSYLLDQTVYKEIDAVVRPKQLSTPEKFRRRKV